MGEVGVYRVGVAELRAIQSKGGRAMSWLAGPPGVERQLWPRWFVLRGIGLCFLSVFVSLWLQVRGLIGENGVLPAARFLERIAGIQGVHRLDQVPTLLWLGSSDRALLLLCGVGLLASVALLLNVWPRLAAAICTVTFLSFCAVLQKFSSFQTDGLLMEAGFIAVFFAPAGVRPGLGAASPPSRLARFALVWLFFRIYFESGLAKIAGDPQWSSLTAMDHYYENGPLPTSLAWSAQELLPHAFHTATTFLTLAAELVLVWGAFLPRLLRRALFCVVTPFQLGIIATANYGCLNYLTLTLGVLLLDDAVFARLGFRLPAAVAPDRRPVWQGAAVVLLSWQLYATATILLRGWPFPYGPVAILTPFRIANAFALFATLTGDHPELEFQGSDDGQHWVAYPYRCKPQDPQSMPGFYAPYQPRFDLALTFAALDRNWHHNDWVVRVEERLLGGSPDVVHLFRADPFAGHPPAYVRTVRWQYSFSSPAQRQADGTFWQRAWGGTFGPTLHRSAAGQVDVAETR